MQRLALLPLSIAAFMLTLPASGQDGANLDSGLDYARERCAECHAVEPDSYVSPDPMAPAFDDLADWPEMTLNYLSVWLVTSHPTMPNLVIEPADVGDLAAYIFSLRN